MWLEVQLGAQRATYERSAYTLFTLAGDVGGFNGAVIIFPTFFLAFYSQKMFEQQIASEFTTRKTKRSSSSPNPTRLRAQIENGQVPDTGLSESDVNCLYGQASKVKSLKTEFWRAVSRIFYSCGR